MRVVISKADIVSVHKDGLVIIAPFSDSEGQITIIIENKAVEHKQKELVKWATNIKE